jgi:hypothetical protein
VKRQIARADGVDRAVHVHAAAFEEERVQKVAPLAHVAFGERLQHATRRQISS